MSIKTIPPPKERLPGPYPAKRPCASCGAFLRTCNPGPLCDPCSTPALELVEEDPILAEAELERTRVLLEQLAA